MTLRELLRRQDVPPVAISGLVSNSHKVTQGCAFIALEGDRTDGHHYIREAVAKGAVAIIAERPKQEEERDLDVAWIEQPDIRARLGTVASQYFGDPSARLKIAGVTGTNGKTSVAFLASHARQSTAFMGSIGWGFPGRLHPSQLTTEDPVTLQKRLAWTSRQGATGVVMEVSSHALSQDRAQAVLFDVAVLTNFSRDHLDYHGSMEAYGAAKRTLFERQDLKAALVNVDSEFGKHIATGLDQRVDAVIRYGSDPSADVTWNRLRATESGLISDLRTPWGKFSLELSMIGEIAVQNGAAAFAIAVVLGADPDTAIDRLRVAPQIPGRLERLPRKKGLPQVYVDYAHTPAALSNALAAVRTQTTGSVVCVFGCGGDRDRGKRALMAQKVDQHAETAVVTVDNPRTEDPRQIITEILEGFSNSSKVSVEFDRKEAIRTAIVKSGPHDTVLISGKGNEDYLEQQGTRYSFDDRLVAMEIMGGPS